MVFKLSLTDLPIKGKKVLMRVDFNVPLDGAGNIIDDTRITSSLPSIRYVLEHGASLVLMSHLGRPKDQPVKALSLKPCAVRLSQLLGKEVLIASDCIGPEVEKMVQALKPGQVLLLENLRFHRGEEHPDEDPAFVAGLAKLGDFYVDDAFGAAHRNHASITKITEYFPETSGSGLLLEKEIRFLSQVLVQPKHPFYAVLGGAKISTKIGVVKALLKTADKLLIGGGMSYTFFKAQEISIGNSIHEDDSLGEAKKILQEAGDRLLLPVDLVIAKNIQSGEQTMIVDVDSGIPDGFQGVDIGPKTIKLYEEVLRDAATVLWNGPLGIFEIPEFAKGTDAMAKRLAVLDCISIVGGGDSIAALQANGTADKVTHLSTGGGASLEYLEAGSLPGIESLTDKKRDNIKKSILK
jgi:phosphoglycerate kinase